VAIACPKCHSENPETKQFCADCGTRLPSPQAQAIPPGATKTVQAPVQELTTGTAFAGRYQVIEELGKGGMGRVYKVFDAKIKEKVALKLIKPEIAVDREALDRFGNELKFARRIVHRNICRMFDLGEAEGTHFITMEYVSGENLKTVIRMTGSLAVGTVLSIGKQVADGLAEAHGLGIVHRDLKPQNIMIDQAGRAKIMDFGIARSLQEKGITGPGVMIGTPEYRSPEQAEAGGRRPLGHLFAGVILYEMATGRFRSRAHALSVAMKHKRSRPRIPVAQPEYPGRSQRRDPEMPGERPSKRYPSAAELRAEVERIEKGLPTAELAEPERATPAHKPFTSKEITVKFSLKKIALPGMAVLALAAAAILLLTLLPKKRAPVGAKIENSIAVVSFKNQTGDPAYDYLQEVIPNLLITNLENTGLFAVTTWERMRDILKQMGVKQAEVIDSDLGFEFCRREGIQAVAIGAFSKAGEVFIMDVKVLDAGTKRTLKSANTRGVGADSIFGSQVDGLSREIALGLGAGRDKVETAQLDIKGITTHSLDAYRYFLEGKEACNLHDWTEARKNLGKALEIDPAFGTAYVYLAWTYVDTGPEEAIAETLEKAKALSDKSSQKDALYLDGLYAYFVQKDTRKAVQHVDELLRRYPDEKWAFHISGDFVRKDGDLEGAYGRYQKWLGLDPQDSNALYHLSNVSLLMGNLEKAEEYIKRHEAVASPEVGNLRSQALIYRRLGQVDNSIARYQKVREIRPDYPLTPRLLYSLKEDYDEAMKWADEGLSRAESPEGRSALFSSGEISIF
jgi:serine/threonine protein kinase/tetratricopeptide (TPR) repeat protein